MNILIIGNGGREHALAWKARQSSHAQSIFVAPGNAGTALEPGITNVNISPTDVEGLVSFAKETHIDLTIVGPEAALAAGVTDAFEQAGLKCFGPTRRAANLESSKNFAKAFLSRHNIPTADYRTFTDIGQAKTYVSTQTFPLVIKADGLAAGKGVVIAQNLEQAEAALASMLVNEDYGQAGHRVVIEEFLKGEEASFICMVDGEQVIPLATSQDHKARDEGDKGPNTGGMGAYSPAPVISPEIHKRIMNDIIHPTLQGLSQEGIHYRGFLYAGLMINAKGEPFVIEFNCRLGDPETQPILMRLQSDIIEACLAATEGNLTSVDLQWDPRSAVGVVLAAAGYPAKPRRGDKISGLTAPSSEDSLYGDISNSEIKVFHAGTSLESGEVITSGGRVLCVTALGNTLIQARENAYNEIDHISWEGCFYRSDIANKGIKKCAEPA